jgi:dTMP kinase
MSLEYPNGLVITLDGPDYIGKTTQIERCQALLENDGFDVVKTRVNGGTPIGEALRSVMLANYDRPALSDLHIHLAQQYALAEQLSSWRAAGKIILIDRSPLSIIGYQVYGSGLDQKTGYEAADLAVKLLAPDLMICYVADDKILKSRRDRNQSPDYFESKPASYFKRLSVGYQDAARHYNAKIISANGSVDHVNDLTMSAIRTLTKSTPR